ncbi:H(+)-transporting ATP synthase, subunit gamma [Sporocytophaga myxococcoides]|uniref:H(+)-transporting ATP synthase, subunit gamma n=1 Tax=Sporocytophaga myxococcoides TaxID=153721 RepID=A0A098LH57_9BACT|nr:F0F1 ATP synthase subunit gamma [Sporocytophaga myxococcoides]GAL85742.1 H(+)-transporting ATP synthase, subunit gamma [Sporocytophaga myxococcoides]
MESIEGFKEKVDGLYELHSVVKTMKLIAGSSLGQYEQAVIALQDYNDTVEVSLSTFFRGVDLKESEKGKGKICLIVFGTDQGLVGEFNSVMKEFLIMDIKNDSYKVNIFCIGEKLRSDLEEAGFVLKKTYEVPNSVKAINPLVGQILLDVLSEMNVDGDSLKIYNHRPLNMSLYQPSVKHVLPLELKWKEKMKRNKWPSNKIPQIIGRKEEVLFSLINEYLFVSLFQSCAESLSSENSSRFASMQRAEKNIEQLLDDYKSGYNRLRQNKIDEELFDLISGFDSLKK